MTWESTGVVIFYPGFAPPQNGMSCVCVNSNAKYELYSLMYHFLKENGLTESCVSYVLCQRVLTHAVSQEKRVFVSTWGTWLKCSCEDTGRSVRTTTWTSWENQETTRAQKLEHSLTMSELSSHSKDTSKPSQSVQGCCVLLTVPQKGLQLRGNYTQRHLEQGTFS